MSASGLPRWAVVGWLVCGLGRGFADPVAPTRSLEEGEAQRAQRQALVLAWVEQAELLDRTRTTVIAKADAADQLRQARVRAAAKILVRADARTATTPGLDVARRRAAATLLMTRDRAEVAMLRDELAALAEAATEVAAGVAQTREQRMPAPGLQWPAEGTVVRRFGDYTHVRSKATLSRRGLDLEVEQHSRVKPVAAGTVIYAGPIRGLDLGVIVDHGTYVSVLAKLGKVTRAPGDLVAPTDQVGRTENSRLYLEIRVKIGAEGSPLDPETLLPPRT